MVRGTEQGRGGPSQVLYIVSRSTRPSTICTSTRRYPITEEILMMILLLVMILDDYDYDQFQHRNDDHHMIGSMTACRSQNRNNRHDRNDNDHDNDTDSGK